MVDQHLMCGLLWVLFCVLHSVFASGKLKRKTKAVLPRFAPYYRLVYTLFAFVSLAVVVIYQVNMTSPVLYSPTLFTKAAGVVIGVSGLVVMAICIRKYFLGLSGLKSLFQAIPSHGLIITGVHRYVRHPLYSGTFLAIWGFFLLVPLLSLLVSNSIITLYTLWAIRYEEEKLVAEFGADYISYRKRVPTIIPSFRSKQA